MGIGSKFSSFGLFFNKKSSFEQHKSDDELGRQRISYRKATVLED